MGCRWSELQIPRPDEYLASYSRINISAGYTYGYTEFRNHSGWVYPRVSTAYPTTSCTFVPTNSTAHVQ